MRLCINKKRRVGLFGIRRIRNWKVVYWSRQLLMMLIIVLSYSLLLGNSFKTVSLFLSNAYWFRVLQKYLFTIVSWHAYLFVLVPSFLRYLSVLSIINIRNRKKVIMSGVLFRCKSLVELFRNFSRVCHRPSYHVLFVFILIKRLVLILVIVIIRSKWERRLLDNSSLLLRLWHYSWSIVKVRKLLISISLL